MDLVEHQAKRYLARWAIPVPQGGLAHSVEEVAARSEELGYPVAIKAQVATGGRGKAGGIALAVDAAQAAEAASAILGMSIKGHVVHSVWVERAVSIRAEHYVSITLDRAARRHLVMVCARGGMDIEDIAASDPELIVRHHVVPGSALSLGEAMDLVDRAGLGPSANQAVAETITSLYRAYVEGDADLVEVNPLGVGEDGSVVALDAKVVLDDNAAFRHPEWQGFAADGESDPREVLAHRHGLNYIGLDGNVGVIANGAGMAMATIDLVAQAGGRAANFLDIGGGASASVMASALEVIDADPGVSAILINIFGGITRCDEVARGIVEAVERVEIASPIVLRLEGTNAAEGRAVIQEHAPRGVVVVSDMAQAAEAAVRAGK